MAANPSWAFTDRHADLGYAAYFEDPASFGEVDWSVMARDQWGGDPDLKERRQAEFLVHDFCPWDAFEEVGAGTVAVQKAAQAILATASHRPSVVVRPDWYY